MNKRIRMFIVILAILMIIYIPISYAIENKNILPKSEPSNNEILKILEVDSNEKTIGSTLNININISKVEYDNFKIKLASSSNLNELKVENNNKELEIKKEDNSFYLIINKGSWEIDKVCLTYTIPNTLKVGEKFTLTGSIIEIKDGEEEKEPIVEDNIEISIVENTNKEQEKQNEKESNINKEENSAANNQIQESIIITKTSSMSLKSANSTSAETYKGSNNNYLNNIKVEGYDLNTEFTKENTTYFITVPNTIETLNITTEKEASSSTVCIYGNSGLQVGTNKVLISVTAENGDVRTYRIFVTRESK